MMDQMNSGVYSLIALPTFGVFCIAILWVFLRNNLSKGRWLQVISLGSVAISIITFIISTLLLGPLLNDQGAVKTVLLGIRLHIDALSLYFILVVNIIAAAASWNAHAYLQSPEGQKGFGGPALFLGLMNLFHATMLISVIVDNLVVLWIAIEATTIASALLVAYPNHRRSWEAAWKYVIITSTGIILALIGTIFLAHAVSSGSDTLIWSKLIEYTPKTQNEKSMIFLAFLFILVGYGTKAGLAPMHTWLPDAHSEAAPPVSALLSGVLLKASFYAILRYYTMTNVMLGESYHTLINTILLTVGLFSLVLAVPFILKRNRFKRVLAYHSLEHMGIILFGVGIGMPVALFGALLHVLNHAITKALMFLAYGNILRSYASAFGDKKLNDEDISGVLQAMPYTGMLLILGGLALVGTPPFNVFMSIWMILWGGFQRTLGLSENGTAGDVHIGFMIALIVFILSTTIIYFGMAHHLNKRVMGSASFGKKKLPESFISELAPLFVLAILIIIMGLWIYPSLAVLLNQSVAIVLHHTMP